VTMPWSNQAVSLVVIIAGGGFTGLFVYSGAPATGNLIASVAAAAGTDPYGNTYPGGISSQTGGIEATLAGGFLSWDAPADSPSSPPLVLATPSAASGSSLEITTGVSSLSATAGALTLYDSAASSTVPAIPSGSPGIFVAAGCPLVTDTWHSLGGPGITNLTSDHGRYRFSPNGDVEFDIAAHATGAVTAGLYPYPNTLPSAYRPAVSRSYAVGLPHGSGGPARIFVQTSGTVSLDIPALSSGNVIGCSAFMPLD